MRIVCNVFKSSDFQVQSEIIFMNNRLQVSRVGRCTPTEFFATFIYIIRMEEETVSETLDRNSILNTADRPRRLQYDRYLVYRRPNPGPY
jgi:hypothetical protein